MSEAVTLSPARYVTVELAAKTHGLTPAASRKRIERGQWLERREFFRPADGRIWICVPAARKALRLAEEETIRRRALPQRPLVIPAWADREAIAHIYRQCAAKTQATGVRHEVDHIIPLRGRRVTGLHVDNNLQILTRAENIAKGNRFSP